MHKIQVRRSYEVRMIGGYKEKSHPVAFCEIGFGGCEGG